MPIWMWVIIGLVGLWFVAHIVLAIWEAFQPCSPDPDYWMDDDFEVPKASSIHDAGSEKDIQHRLGD